MCYKFYSAGGHISLQAAVFVSEKTLQHAQMGRPVNRAVYLRARPTESEWDLMEPGGQGHAGGALPQERGPGSLRQGPAANFRLTPGEALRATPPLSPPQVWGGAFHPSRRAAGGTCHSTCHGAPLLSPGLPLLSRTRL